MRNVARGVGRLRRRRWYRFRGEDFKENDMSETNIQEVVRQKYGDAAKQVAAGGTACCGGGGELSGCDPITKNLYDDAQKAGLPAGAVAASLGCGNPTALAKLQPGEVVLDLGSGGGIDVLLSAKRVGPTGKAYGLDMTDEMLALANENKRKAGADVVTRGEIDAQIRQNILLWVGCVAGALEEDEYRDKLVSAGFEQVDIEPTRIYRVEDAREFLSEKGLDVDAMAPQVDGKFMSAFVRATKSKSAKTTEACCAPACCK